LHPTLAHVDDKWFFFSDGFFSYALTEFSVPEILWNREFGEGVRRRAGKQSWRCLAFQTTARACDNFGLTFLSMPSTPALPGKQLLPTHDEESVTDIH
jgi:hypothetical protein